MLEVMQAQAKHLEMLEEQVKQMSQGQASGRQYMAELEARGTSGQSAGNPQGAPDFDSMTQQELATHMSQTYSGHLANMANQFGELLEIIAPQWDGWKMRDAIYGLMSRGQSPKQAYETVKKAALESNPAGQNPGGNNDKAAFDTAVEKRAAELAAQQRSAKAGISGKPARNDATAPALLPRELHSKLWQKIMVEGEEIPSKYTRGL